ncbi:uroporphyrinogen decarboxylase [Haoranjiania flava]|uniref:Uroporphyrinogen decarboxylase n=1 Tax=Haoranjiania flava TaxID=1856322 RepID=A0AAE3IN02_9BACT|nr:uroporphyrinogen decarboxylase [Haoranjiania flava]MCU7694088.1 uroporphyrinogen decarboxylase [Haoranjiania flava]
MNYAELTGYIAMTLLVISFIPKQVTSIRIINLVACIFFVIYGILLGVLWPVIISNGLVGLVQLYHLLRRTKKLSE